MEITAPVFRSGSERVLWMEFSAGNLLVSWKSGRVCVMAVSKRGRRKWSFSQEVRSWLFTRESL